MPVKSTRRKKPVDSKLPLIRCSRCGAEITLVPNLKLLSDAIEAHIDLHMARMQNAANAEAQAEQIRDDLIKQVLEKASEQGALTTDTEKDTR